jgi:membrane protein
MEFISRLRLWELTRRTVRDSLDDRLPGLAAEVAFFLLLSLPPMLLVALGVMSFLGTWLGQDAVNAVGDQLIEWAGAVLTSQTINDSVRPAVTSLLERGRIDVLSIGIVTTVWSASRASRIVITAVTVAYDLEDMRRTWWRRYGLGLALTVGGIVAVAILLPLLVLGPEFGAGLADRYGLARAFEITWRLLYWPVVIAVGMSLLAWVYNIIPPWKTPWVRDLPGAALALVAWGLGSFGLRVYGATFIGSDSAYRLVGAPLVVLLWVYVTSLAFLAGAELNAEIERMWPRANVPFPTDDAGPASQPSAGPPGIVGPQDGERVADEPGDVHL